MMERIKRWISGVLVCCILLTLAPMAAFAGDEVVASGTCGDDLTWTLDEDGVLTISGTGEMFSTSDVPWDSLRSSIKTVVVEPGVTSIGEAAFSECNGLTSVTLPEGLTSIEANAFNGCVDLTSMIIPSTVTSIGGAAFSGCDSLTDVELPDSLTVIPMSLFYGCDNLIEVALPEGVTHIGDKAFYACRNLTTVEFPDGLTSIGSEAFSGCKSLTDVDLPSGITCIEEYTFCGCASLTNVTFPRGLTIIGRHAFSGCIRLSSVAIPPAVNSIGYLAFGHCTGIQGIWVDEENEYFSSDKDGVLFNKEKTSLIQAPISGIAGTYAVPEETTCIEEAAFYQCPELSAIELPEGLIRIGVAAFNGCDLLESIEIPKSLEYIGRDSFGGCDGLSSIRFSGSAPSIVVEDSWAGDEYPSVFGGVTAIAYYPANDPSWTEEKMQGLGFDYSDESVITWIPYDVDEQPGEDAPSEELKVFCYSSNEMSELFGQEGPMEMSYTFDYDDGWFLENNGAYNHELAKMSIRAAMAAFNSDTEQAGGDNAYYIKALMEKLGYDYDDDSIQYPDPTRYSIGYAIGSKDISDDTSVIMVAVRGGGYAAEWHNNVVVGKTGDHQGFDEASIQVGDGIGAYINAHKGDLKPNIKVWLVGFSRAAAVANLTAADLCDGFIDEISSDDVFAYCFACPQGTVDKNASSSKYSGIKNIVNPIDLVPKVAMSDWGFTRYGATYYLPYAEYTINYSQMKQRMEAQYEMLLKYNGMTDAAQRMDTVTALTTESDGQVSSFTDVATYVAELIDRSEYTSSLQETIGSVVDALMGDGMSDAEFLDTLIPLIITEAAAVENDEVILTRILRVLAKHPDAPEDLGKLSNLMIAHYPELYLAWVDSLDSAYRNYNGKYRKVFVNCPVDVTVYDHTGEAVAQIVDDEVIQSDGGVIASIDEDGQKVLILPLDAAYEVGLTATDDGTMSYMVAEYDMESQSSSYIVSYYDVQIKSGDVLTGLVTEAVEDGAAQYTLLDTDGEEIVPTRELAKEEVVAYPVDVMAEGHGTVGATPCKLEGEYVTMYATALDGEEFLGWYDGEDLVSQEENYRFRVESEVSLVGKFTKLFHEGETVAATKDPTCTDPGTVTYACDICGDSYVDLLAAAKGHTFIDGICSDCGETDPDYEQSEDPSEPGTPTKPADHEDSKENEALPVTSDCSVTGLVAALVLVGSAMVVLKKKED